MTKLNNNIIKIKKDIATTILYLDLLEAKVKNIEDVNEVRGVYNSAIPYVIPYPDYKNLVDNYKSGVLTKSEYDSVVVGLANILTTNKNAVTIEIAHAVKSLNLYAIPNVILRKELLESTNYLTLSNELNSTSNIQHIINTLKVQYLYFFIASKDFDATTIKEIRKKTTLLISSLKEIILYNLYTEKGVLSLYLSKVIKYLLKNLPHIELPASAIYSEGYSPMTVLYGDSTKANKIYKYALKYNQA